jgi:hypothetical protein
MSAGSIPEPPAPDSESAGDLRGDPDVPPGIRYDPDLAVHEPMETTEAPVAPGRRRSPLLLFAVGLLALSAVIYALFGLIARETRTSSDYLNEIRIGRGEAWRAAYELSRLIPVEDPRRRDPALGRQLISLLDQARDGDALLRRYLVLSLGELREAESADALIGALADNDTETRLYAAWGLAALGERRAGPAVRVLLDDPDAGVRKMAAYALGALGDPVQVEPLRAALNDPVDEVAWNAALALARLGDTGGLPLLGRLLDRAYLDGRTRTDDAGRARPIDADRKEELLINALRALALLGDRSHLDAVRALRDSDPSPNVRQAAIEALERIETSSR